MGVAESKVLAENVLAACQSAENNGKSILDDKSLWRNEDMCRAAKDIYRYIPKSIRGPSRQSTIKKAIRRSTDRLIIPPIVQELQDKRKELFPSEQGDGSVTALMSLSTPLAHYYKLGVQWENQQDLDKIRLRLLYVAFYRLKQDQQPGSLYEKYDADSIAQAIFETGSISDSNDIISGNVRKWIGYGERYSLLAADLGGLGVLYILPDLGGETLWNKELPKSADHEHRISIIKTLRELGISQEAGKRGLHTSGNAEVGQIFMALRNALPSQARNTNLTQGHSQTQAREATSSSSNGSVLSFSAQEANSLSIAEDGQLLEPQRNIPHASTTSLPEQTLSRFCHGDLIAVNTMRNPGNSEPDSLQSRRASGALDISTGARIQNTSRSFHQIQNTSDIHEQYGPIDVIQAQQPLTGPGSGPIPSEFTLMTPTNYPQVFPLLEATTMLPSNHPQLFLPEPACIFPMNYPQVFPFENSANVTPDVSRLEHPGQAVGVAGHPLNAHRYSAVAV